MSVGGFAGNNNVTLSTTQFNNQYQLLVQDSVNGGPTSSQMFLLSTVDSVNVNLGSGDDTLNWDGLFKADNVTDIPVYTAMGGGFDTLNLGGGSTFGTFNVGSIITSINFAGARISNLWNFDAERLELHGNNGGSDTFNINSQNTDSTIYVYSGGGNSKCVIGPDVMASSDPSVFFYGAGSANTLELNGSTLGFNQYFTVLGGIVQRFVPGNPFASEVHFDSAVQTVTIKGGAGNDTFQMLSLLAGQTLNATGNGGDDTFNVGKNQPIFPYSFTANILGTINAVGGPGNDLLFVDDVTSNGVLNGFTITSTSLVNNNTTGELTFDSTLEQFEYDASNHGSQFITVFGLPAVTSLNLFGGTGLGDTLIVDDHTLAVAPFRVDVGPDYYKEYYGTVQNPTIRSLPPTSGFENLRLVTHDSTNAINIYGTGTSPVGQSLQINSGAGADAITLYPHDINGNLTINGSVSIFGGGGSDDVIIDDTGQANPINYVFTNTFAGLIDRIDGLGAGTLAPASNVENVTIKGGDGDDTFDFNQHKLSTGVAIYAGGGNDVLNIGGGDLPSNITNLPSFLFDGQDGFDQFNLNNATETSQWQYIRDVGAVRADRGTPTFGYSVVLQDANLEQMTVNAGAAADVFYVRALAAGTSTILNAGDGLDGLVLADSTQNLVGIQGLVRYNAGAAGGNILVSDDAATTDETVHLTDATLGAMPGDDLFGPGGSLEFSDLVNFGVFPGITLNLGSGADYIYAQPLATARAAINAGNPASAPGDILNLSLAGAANYQIDGTPASGNVTSDNLQTLSWSGFETGPNIDDVAPFIVTQGYDESGSVPAILVQFSEDVSAALSVNYLELINSTTAEQVSPGLMALAYDAGTNTASFTFPGYAGGILPRGDYTAKIYGTLTDLFGNPMGVETPLGFSVLNQIPVVDPNGPDPGTYTNTWIGITPVSIVDPVMATVTDADDAILTSLTISIANPAAHDVLSATAMGGITVSGDGTAELTFSGDASLADYEATLRTVTYNNTAGDEGAGPITINFTAVDPLGGIGISSTQINIDASAEVVGRQLFYNQSGTATRYDHNDAAINSFDDLAIATDKTAYLWEDPGAATFANVSSYSKGINGIMVDISGSHPSITAADFIFRVGNNNSPGLWGTANAPSAVSVRAGAGVSGSDRVEIIWATGQAPIKQWLEVITLANANTGLAQAVGYPAGQGDAFFFGNALGDSGLGDTAINAITDAQDESGARLHPAALFTNIPVTNIYDYNRDAKVDSLDENVSRLNTTNFATHVKYLNLTTAPAAPEADGFAGDEDIGVPAMGTSLLLAMGTSLARSARWLLETAPRGTLTRPGAWRLRP